MSIRSEHLEAVELVNRLVAAIETKDSIELHTVWFSAQMASSTALLNIAWAATRIAAGYSGKTEAEILAKAVATMPWAKEETE